MVKSLESLSHSETVAVFVNGQLRQYRTANPFEELSDLILPAGPGPHSWQTISKPKAQ